MSSSELTPNQVTPTNAKVTAAAVEVSSTQNPKPTMLLKSTNSSATLPLIKTKHMRINLSSCSDGVFEGTGGGSRYVKLNVGGRLFMTTTDTLSNHPSMFSAMVSGRMELVTDQDDWVLIDRDGTLFEHVLNFFRDGFLDVRLFSDKELSFLLTEAKYYSIDELVHILTQAIEDRAAAATALAENNFSFKEVKMVPYICTKQMDESSLFDTGKASVKFLCNRQNNKYSYTSQADENLLKNIELFDKLAVLYQGRLNFFKDIFGFSSNEICQWTFYNKLGAKRAEVCCSSIVYATERKNIKIEFPEAKVQEELIFLLADEGHPEPVNNDVIRAMRCRHSTSAMP